MITIDTTGYLIYYDGSCYGHTLDVTYNCWEDNKIPQQLGPHSEYYKWDPTWCPHDPDTSRNMDKMKPC